MSPGKKDQVLSDMNNLARTYSVDIEQKQLAYKDGMQRKKEQQQVKKQIVEAQKQLKDLQKTIASLDDIEKAKKSTNQWTPQQLGQGEKNGGAAKEKKESYGADGRY